MNNYQKQTTKQAIASDLQLVGLANLADLNGNYKQANKIDQVRTALKQLYPIISEYYS